MVLALYEITYLSNSSFVVMTMGAVLALYEITYLSNQYAKDGRRSAQF